MRAYKFLDRHGCAPFTGTPWEPDVWVESATAAPCVEGVHACEPRHLAYWLGARLWEVELDGSIATAQHKLVASRGRLVKEITDYPGAVRALGTERLARWRGAVEEALAAAEDADAAALLASAPDAIALAALTTLDETTGGRRLVGLLADAAAQLRDDNPVTALFILACCAGYLDAGAGEDQADFDHGFATERAMHSTWLTDQLQLA